jgi:broad-specificity NMP kinase
MAKKKRTKKQAGGPSMMSPPEREGYAEGSETEFTKAERFDAAFINARERGDKDFEFEGKKYNTKTAEEELAKMRERERGEDEADLSESE